MFAVIGDPVEHSISPLLHTKVFSLIGVTAAYTKRRVRALELPTFFKEFRGARDQEIESFLHGVNVTLPHKIAVIPLLDEIRGDAALSGAVNTAVREDARLIGYNTDMEGLLRSIRALGYDYAGSVVTIYGTGGAALGAAVKAADTGAKEIRVVGRSAENAKRVADAARASCANAETNTAVSVFSIAQATDAVSGADILINATPLGMQGFGQDFDAPEFLDALPARALVYDCVYTPAETTLVSLARARGLTAATGLSMLVWQGLLSDILFFAAAGLAVDADEILSERVRESVYNVLSKELYEKR